VKARSKARQKTLVASEQFHNSGLLPTDTFDASEHVLSRSPGLLIDKTAVKLQWTRMSREAYSMVPTGSPRLQHCSKTRISRVACLLSEQSKLKNSPSLIFGRFSFSCGSILKRCIQLGPATFERDWLGLPNLLWALAEGMSSHGARSKTKMRKGK
jgi:hypothetical protein